MVQSKKHLSALPDGVSIAKEIYHQLVYSSRQLQLHFSWIGRLVLPANYSITVGAVRLWFLFYNCHALISGERCQVAITT